MKGFAAVLSAIEAGKGTYGCNAGTGEYSGMIEAGLLSGELLGGRGPAIS